MKTSRDIIISPSTKNEAMAAFFFWKARAEKAEAELAALKTRSCEAAQILIAEVGADGPANVDEVAAKAVSTIRRLEAELTALKRDALDICLYLRKHKNDITWENSFEVRDQVIRILEATKEG